MRMDDISDARPEVFDMQIERLRNASDLEDASVLHLDTTQPVENSVEAVRLTLRHRMVS